MSTLRSALSLAWLAVAPLAAPAQVPALSHTAPQIGNELTLELAGALPGFSVRLYFSSDEASTATPYGTLELERSGLTLIASGPADPQGHFVHQQVVPPDPALAETWGHYQALVQDASAPNGWVLSQAVHLRYLGTRLYETSLGIQFEGQVHPAELRVVSLPQAHTLGVLSLADLPLPYVVPKGDDGEPVFSADLSLGAVVPSADRLVVFDNFGLVTLSVLPLQAAALHVLPGLDGRSVVVLEAGPPSRILWIDLPTGTITDSLDLPAPIAPRWVVGGSLDQVWVGESDPTSGRCLLRHVDLAARAVLEAVRIGPGEASSLLELCWAPGWLFATTQLDGWIYTLTEVNLAAVPPTTVQLEFGDTAVAPTPLLELETLLLTTKWSQWPGSMFVSASQFGTPSQHRTLPQPPSFSQGNDIEYLRFCEDGDGFWALHPCCDWDGGAGAILHFSIPDQEWREIGSFGWGGPWSMALARDASTYLVAVAADGVPCRGCPTPELILLEVSTASLLRIPGSWGPIALHALTLP